MNVQPGRLRLALFASIVVVAIAGMTLAQGPAGRSSSPEPPAPIVVVETSKGSFTFETFPADAPLTVAHIVSLVRRGFYDGQRVHRAIPGFVVQFGDPQTRDLSRRELWGSGPAAVSGQPIGAAEIKPGRVNRKGAVGVSHMGDPSKGDSQIYVTLANRPDLDGRYAVFGQVIAGDDVPGLLSVGDEIVKVTIKE
jgi:cyclophilin family peptidyl-prolyl cis-trans isomerase